MCFLPLISALLAVLALPAVAQEESLFGISPSGITYGPYAKIELGFDQSKFENGFWESPGASDPTVFFDLDDDSAGFASVGIGFDRMDGFRGDVSFMFFGRKTVEGPWSFTVPATPGPHADMSTSVKSTALMGTLYYSPYEARGDYRTWQPHLIAGLGIASNNMSDWTRTNTSATRITRTFEGASQTDLAWSIGIGSSWQIRRDDKNPIMIDLSYRYFDLGSARGGSAPLPGEGTSSPRQPLEFDVNSSVISFGVRMPLY